MGGWKREETQIGNNSSGKVNYQPANLKCHTAGLVNNLLSGGDAISGRLVPKAVFFSGVDLELIM